MKKQNDQTFAGVFLIGLAMLFLTNYWWPGIMFVIGIAMIARAISEGREWSADRNAIVVLAIGVIFAVWDFLDSSIFSSGWLWPLILIGVGVYLLFGKQIRGQVGGPKNKNDDLL